MFQAVGTLFWRRQTKGIEAPNYSAGLGAASKWAGGRQPTVCQFVKHQVQEVQVISGFTLTMSLKIFSYRKLKLVDEYLLEGIEIVLFEENKREDSGW